MPSLHSHTALESEIYLNMIAALDVILSYTIAFPCLIMTQTEIWESGNLEIYNPTNSLPNLSKKLSLIVSKTGYKININKTINAGAINIIGLIEFSKL